MRISRSLLVLTILALNGTAQQPPVFDVSTRLVLADVSVTDLDTGLPIRRLLAEDFVVREAGFEMPIRVFGAVSLPLDIVLVVDTTGGTMMRDPINDIRTPVQTLLQDLGIEDHLGVVSVNGNVTTHAPLSGRDQGSAAAREAVLKQSRGDTTAKLLAGITAAAGLFKGPRSQERRRVIMVVTHNVEVASAKSLELASTAVGRADAMLVGVVVPFVQRTSSGQSRGVGLGLPIPGVPRIKLQTRVKTTETVVPEGGALDALVKATGGEVLRPVDVPFEVSTLLGRLRSSYLLGFYAGETKGFHPIHVELSPEARSREGVVGIQNRTGYWQ